MTDWAIAGRCAPGFEQVRDAFETNFREADEFGASFAAILNGDVVVDLRGGWADRAATRPWSEETIVPVYSVTKAIAALVVARLLERSDAGYETPVSDIWPEFAAHGKDRVTIGETLSHQAGLPGFAEEIDRDLWLDPPALAARLADEAPLWPPGDGSGYHPLTWGYLAGEIALRLSGRTLGHVLRDEICGPLGIDFQIGLPDTDHHRCADLLRPKAMPALGPLNDFNRAAFLTKWAAPDRGGPDWRRVEIPSANGHGNALSVARLYGAYAHGGQIDGVALFNPDTYDALTRRRAFGQDRVLPFVMDFAAGVFRNHEKLYGPNETSLAHSGWGGSAAFGDPDRGLSAAYVMNRQSNRLQGDPRSIRLFDALYACL
ncbi:MAG: serine hydrolase domain-containing protein [Pseudomonadota bacterium]